MRARYLAFFLLAAMIVAAVPLSIAPGPEVRAQVSLTIMMRDSLSFDPASFSAEPGESVSLTVINAGALDHTFTLFGQVDANVPVTDFSELQNYYNANAKLVDLSFGGGGQGSDSFTAPMAEGTYTFVCMISGHATGGMHGTFTVSTGSMNGGPAPIDPLLIGIVVAVVVIVIAVAGVFILRRRS